MLCGSASAADCCFRLLEQQSQTASEFRGFQYDSADFSGLVYFNWLSRTFQDIEGCSSQWATRVCGRNHAGHARARCSAWSHCLPCTHLCLCPAARPSAGNSHPGDDAKNRCASDTAICTRTRLRPIATVHLLLKVLPCIEAEGMAHLKQVPCERKEQLHTGFTAVSAFIVW